MTTKKQIIANRKNAQKSTGPNTPTGKAIVSKNSLKHGLLAQQLLLPDEDENQLDQFREMLTTQLDPADLLESLMVERIIAAAWRLRRLLRIETEMMTDDLNPKTPKWDLHNLLPGSNKDHSLGASLARKPGKMDIYDKLRRYEAHIERGLYKALHQLQKIQAERRQHSPPFPDNLNHNIIFGITNNVTHVLPCL